MLVMLLVRSANCSVWRTDISRRKASRDAPEPARTPVPIKPLPAAWLTGGHMALSALPEQAEPVFEIGDGCESIVILRTGTYD